MANAVKTHDSEVTLKLKVKVKTDELDKSEVTDVLGSAVRHEIELARARREEFFKDCKVFEDKYHFSSNEFLERFESGELGDDADWFSWYFVKEAFDKWDRHLQILLGVSL